MDKIKRAVHIDFHTMPGIYDFGRAFDAKVFAKRLKDSHITIANVFAQCNIGFSYYPTKTGIPYPYMKGDMFGAILDECHKVGIKVVAYINVGLNHEQARKHPDWCRVDSEGRIIRGDRTGNFFRTMCYNSNGYKEYLLNVIKEICNYDIDGLFCDCMVLEPCYCNSCTEDMKAKGYDIKDDDNVLKFSYEVMLDISKAIRDIVPKNKYLYLNGMPYDAVKDLDSHIEVECLPSGGWGYDYFTAQASYARNLQKNVIYMTGRFQASWGDFGGFKTKASIENDLYDALCQGLQVSVGDHMHPAENLEKDLYDTIGNIYKKLELYEKWTDNAVYLSDIGIIRDKAAYNKAILPDEIKGITRMLSELKYSFDIINEDMDFHRFKLIILPDSIEMTDDLASKLQLYLNNGGKILSSGFAGINNDKSAFALDDYRFLTFEGIDESNSSYYRYIKPIGIEPDMKWAIYEHGILMTAKDEENKIALYVKPYFNRHWDGFHGFFYTPPEKETGYSAAAMNDNVCHICFKVFSAYYKYASLFHKNLIGFVLKQMLSEPIIKAVSMPSTSRVTATGTDAYTLIHIKVTYPEARGLVDIVEEHNVLPAGYKVSLRGKYSAVKRLPDEKPVDFIYENGYTIFELPEIVGYDMFIAYK